MIMMTGEYKFCNFINSSLKLLQFPNQYKNVPKDILPFFFYLALIFFYFSFLSFRFTFRSTYYTSLCLAIMRSQTSMFAWKKRPFVSSTLHVIKPHSGFCLHNFFGVIKHRQWSVKVHHSASHISIVFVPLICTYPAPGVVVINLYQSFSGELPSFHQTSWWIE